MKYAEAKNLVKSDPRPYVYEVLFTDTGLRYIGSSAAIDGHHRTARLTSTRKRGNAELREFTIHFCETELEARNLESLIIRGYQSAGAELQNKKAMTWSYEGTPRRKMRGLITDALIEAFLKMGVRGTVADLDVPRFMARIHVSGTAKFWLKRRTHGVRTVIPIGTWPEMSADEARSVAIRLKAEKLRRP